MLQAEPDTIHPAEPGQVAPEAAHPPRRSAALELFVTSDLGAVAEEWRAFERHADCTVFQCYDWLAAWQRHIGDLTATTPAIVIGRHGDETAFILPLALRRTPGGRQLTFLARNLGDYNAPLLAFDFPRLAGDFAGLWRQILALLQHDARFRHDVVMLDKMPERIGVQPNPFLQLAVSQHPSSAYICSLGDDWEQFYTSKRSASTRRRDRSKRKHLAEIGEVAMVTPQTVGSLAETTETLIAQKSRAFARMGVPDIFARPGCREFFIDIATDPDLRGLVHVSRLEVGAAVAATNLGLTFRGTYYHVLASYDDGPISRFGPGAAHLQELLRHAITHGCSTFDFTIGDEPYKRDWCDVELKLYDHISAVTARGHATAAILGLGQAVKRAIKQSPRLWPMVVKARATLGRAFGSR